MGNLAAVETEAAETEQLGWEFEGLIVAQSRINANPPGQFAAVDQDGSPLVLHEGDIVVLQTEYIITSVEIGAGYKGGIAVKARKRIHHGKAIDGSQQVVGLQRR